MINILHPTSNFVPAVKVLIEAKCSGFIAEISNKSEDERIYLQDTSTYECDVYLILVSAQHR